MRKILLSTAALGMMAATGASAQVLADIDTLVATVTGSTPNTAVFSGIAENIADIDGSVVINAEGAVGGSAEFEFTDDQSTSGGGLTIGSEFTFAGLPALGGGGETNLNVFLLAAFDCDVESEGFSGTGECSGGLESFTFTDLFTTTETITTNTTTQMDFGDVSTLAAGAVNDIDMDVAMNGAATVTGAAAQTSNTASNAAFDAVEAASVVGTTIAFNEGAIDGSVSVDLAATSASFSSISTTAAGAINTGSITGSINGVVD